MRTPGSGWGGGPILYQFCPKCGKKKAYFKPMEGIDQPFKCTSCRERFYSNTLIRQTHSR